MIRLGDRPGELVDRSDLEPGLLHLAIGGQALGVLDPRLGVDQRERSDPLGGQQRRAQRQKATLRHATQHGAVDPQVLEQAQAIPR